MNSKLPFCDFLNLAEFDSASYDWIVFCGVSGSGKTTSINWLMEQSEDHSFEIVDEIQTIAELRRILRQRKKGRTFLIASHVPLWIHFMIRPLGARQKIFQVDRNRGQIQRWLEQHEFSFSAETVKRFTQKYGASFVDLQTIAESCEHRDFDTAFHQFEKLHRIERTPE